MVYNAYGISLQNNIIFITKKFHKLFKDQATINIKKKSYFFQRLQLLFKKLIHNFITILFHIYKNIFFPKPIKRHI